MVTEFKMRGRAAGRGNGVCTEQQQINGQRERVPRKIPSPRIFSPCSPNSRGDLAFGLRAVAAAAMLPHRETCHSGLHLLCRQAVWRHECCWITERENGGLWLQTKTTVERRIQQAAKFSGTCAVYITHKSGNAGILSEPMSCGTQSTNWLVVIH